MTKERLVVELFKLVVVKRELMLGDIRVENRE
jgi:hypothetical protein